MRNAAPSSLHSSAVCWTLGDEQPQYHVPEAALVKMLCIQATTHDVLINEYYKRTYFPAIPAPLMLQALSRTLNFIKSEVSDNGVGQLTHADLALNLTEHSKSRMRVRVTTSFDEFLDMFSGKVCGWEFVGLIFAVSGFAAINFPDRIRAEASPNDRTFKGGIFASEMLAASDACIKICERYGNLNDVLIWLRYSHGILASHILGDMSK